VTHFWTVLTIVGLGALGIWGMAWWWAVRSTASTDARDREVMLKRLMGRPDRDA